MLKSFLNKTIYLSVFLHLAFFCVIILMENAILIRLVHVKFNQANSLNVRLEIEELLLPSNIIENKPQQLLVSDNIKEVGELKVSDLSVKNSPVVTQRKELPKYEQLLSQHFKNIIKSKVNFPAKKAVTILIEINKFGNIISYEFIHGVTNTTFKNALIEKIKIADPVPIPPYTNTDKETVKYLIDLLPPQ